MRYYFNTIIFSVLFLIGSQAYAAVEGEILEDTIAEQADNATLKNEASLFEIISQGMALSLAQCDYSDFCSPEINQSELEQLLDRLNHRISVLGVRYAESESAELEEILLSYSNSLDSYNSFKQKLDELSPEEDDFGDDFDDDFSDADF